MCHRERSPRSNAIAIIGETRVMTPFKLGAAISAATVGLLLTAADATAGGSQAYWPLAKAMRRLDGMHIRVGNRDVRLDRDTLLCSGAGRGVRRNGVRTWARFECTYTWFVGARTYDCEFRAVAVTQRRLSIREARWIDAWP